jgi:hypothetical protein
MRRTLIGVAIGVALVVFTAGLVMAQQAQTQGAARFVSGGVGLEERADMDAMAKEYNLKLIFAITTREYLSEVKVVIQDSGGKTHLSTTADGPWMLVKIPDGDYIIQATMGAQTVVQRRKAGKAIQVVNFLFKP